MRASLWAHRIVVIALVLAGAALILWPVGETYVNNRAGTSAVQNYLDELAKLEPRQLSDELLAARKYNADLPSAALNDPWGSDQQVGATSHSAYLAVLSDAAAMARIRVPKLSIDLPIYHDADASTMAGGAGHMFGTSLPVGGAGNHAVVAAHTGMRARTFFDRLPELSTGDEFSIEVAGQRLKYQVDQILVVEPWELEAVQRVPGQDLVTLVTCYTPPGEHQQRMLVRGARLPDVVSPEIVSVSSAVPPSFDGEVQSWMWPRIGGTAAALLILLAMALSWRQADRSPNAPSGRFASESEIQSRKSFT